MSDVTFFLDQIVQDPHDSISVTRYQNAGHKYWSVDNMLGHFTGFNLENWYSIKRLPLFENKQFKFIFGFIHMPVSYRPALSADSVQALDKDPKCFLVLLSTLEGVVNHDDLTRDLKKLGVPLRKVIILCSNPAYHGKVLDGVSYVCINFWESYTRWHHRLLPELEIITPKERLETIDAASKKFICVNRNIKPHRIYTMYALIKTGMIDEGYVSYHLPKINPKEYREFVKSPLCLKYFPVNEHKDFLNAVNRDMFPRKLDAMNKSHIINYSTGLKSFYRDSVVSVVTESDHRMNFLTEKTFKAIVNMHPFFIIGNPDQHTMLRARGYETFEDLFQTNEVLRYKDANYLFTCLKQKDLRKLKEEYKKVYFEKCKHNYELFWNRKVYWQDIVDEITKTAKEKNIG